MQVTLENICNEISGFLSFPDGWDGEGSNSPKREVVDDTLLF